MDLEDGELGRLNFLYWTSGEAVTYGGVLDKGGGGRIFDPRGIKVGSNLKI